MFEFIKSLLKTKQANMFSTDNDNIGTVKTHQKEFDVNNIDTIDADDYLSLAANARSCAKVEMKNNNYEKAWELFTKQQEYYYLHADKQKFTGSQTIALGATVSEDFANILRLEGNHQQALVHMIYCIAGEYPTVKYKAQKLPSYFKRAKLDNVTFEELEDFIYSLPKPPNYRTIQDQVKQWLMLTTPARDCKKDYN